MFEPLPTPQEMAAWDRAAVQLGMPELLLMEHAGRAAAQVLREGCCSLQGSRVLLLMGAGNNGGDAACMARHLFDAGAQVLVVHTRPLSRYTGVSGQHLRLARRCGVKFAPADRWPDRLDDRWRHPDILVDGLLGTGFSGHLRERERHLVETVNRFHREGCFVLSLDIPSGLDGLSGRPRPVAVEADITVTFAAAKLGLVLPEAAPYVGTLHVCDIAMPLRVREDAPCSCRLLVPSILDHLPRPQQDWHKGKAGHVLVVGGSEGLAGAPQLAARGALRAGAGLVTVAAPALCIRDGAGMPDIMTHALEGGWGMDTEILNSALARADALVIGPGMGRTPEARQTLKALLGREARLPSVIDADALALLAAHPELLRLVQHQDILTPHPGEAGMLLGMSGAEVQADRLAALSKLTALAPCVWVLKGAGSLIRRADGPVSLCPLAAPNLAVGGSGDVLAGSLAALLAQGVDAEMAACLGVYRHARAGQIVAGAFPRRGNSATEIADALPGV